MFRYRIKGHEVRAYVTEDEYYCTNREGEGLFFVVVSRNHRSQLLGTCDFSTRGLTDAGKKAKMRRALTPTSD